MLFTYFTCWQQLTCTCSEKCAFRCLGFFCFIAYLGLCVYHTAVWGLNGQTPKNSNQKCHSCSSLRRHPSQYMVAISGLHNLLLLVSNLLISHIFQFIFRLIIKIILPMRCCRKKKLRFYLFIKDIRSETDLQG